MSDYAVEVVDVSKEYKIGSNQGNTTGNIREVITSSLLAPFRRARSLIGGEAYGAIGSNETMWALKEVNFNVKHGEAVGIIGKNGAGKSTLLKILSRITSPTEGRIRLHGRVGSLLEVGTGFHYELTGRENVYLNGAILGMTRAEIDQKFDEIVDFSGVEKFIDTPVKFYSSGMGLRLGFAVAAHLEPEILVVDEVLAVGDAEFQKKCIGKMSDVAGQGRTVLFVSHNMGAVTSLCDRAIWLDQGQVVSEGSSSDVVRQYLMSQGDTNFAVTLPPDDSKTMALRSVEVVGESRKDQIEMTEPIHVRIGYDVNEPVESAHVICFIHTIEGVNVLGCGDADTNPERLGRRNPGYYEGEFVIPASLLGEGTYTLTVSLSVPFVRVYDRHENIISFDIVDFNSTRRQWQHKRRPGILGLEIPWIYKNEPIPT